MVRVAKHRMARDLHQHLRCSRPERQTLVYHLHEFAMREAGLGLDQYFPGFDDALGGLLPSFTDLLGPILPATGTYNAVCGWVLQQRRFGYFHLEGAAANFLIGYRHFDGAWFLFHIGC